jgi:hypothetical protein
MQQRHETRVSILPGEAHQAGHAFKRLTAGVAIFA